MTDITAPLTELRSAYRAYQNAKRDKKEEITEKYRTRMEEEIRAAIQAEKYAFASLLKDRKEFYGLRVGDIQDHVLRTRNWKVWEDIRDYADIPPETVIRTNAREEREEAARRAEIVYEWIGSTLYVHRDEKTGKALPHTIVYPLHNEGGTYIPLHVDELKLLSKMTGDRKTGIDLALATSAEAKRAYADGEQTVSTHPYDYINDLPFEKHDEFLRIENAKFTDANPWIAEYS